MTFENIFQNTVLCQKTDEGTERTEVFDFRSENFHKIHPKETVMKFFVSEVAVCNFFEKELHHSYFLCHIDNKNMLKIHS